MNILKTWILITVGVSFMLAAGCSGSKVRKYDTTLINACGLELREANVKFDNFTHSAGYLSPIKGQGEKTYMRVHEEHPEIPEKAIVGWTTPDKKKHTTEVAVKSKMPSGKSKLNIIFTINGDETVTVSYEEAK